MLHLSINAGSTYEPGSQDSSSSDTSNDNGSHHTRSLAVQRLLLNEFLRSCDAGTIGPYKKQWNEASARTRNSHVCKAKALVVAGLNVITPGDAGFLWEALKESGTVEKELGTGEQQEDRRYLEALAESYHNASCWETRRQILSIMVDLITFKRMQFYIPGLTEYRFKMARQHLLEHGRGAVVPHTRSPRMRVESKQLDHFLMYITSPHVIQDLPFGQRYLHLSSGRILETPNVIRTMVPNRLAKQYQAYCKETGFTPFSQATMLRILSACSATVRKSLQGLDYIAADGAKGFEDLCEMIGRLEERGLDSETVKIWKRTLKEGKQYLKFDYKNSAQDSSAVVRIMEHSLRTLKEDHPEIVTAYMRQDNAGCYHNSVMLASCSLMKEKTGISVQRVDFSDPQGGKGPCDRKAATVKAHVRRYVNEGHDVQNAQQFQQAMLANGGVSGVRVAIVDAAALPDFLQNCFFDCPFSTGDFVRASQEVSKKVQLDMKVKKDSSEDAMASVLFSCHKEGCIKMYQRHSSLDKHLSFGKCKMVPEKETLFDRAKTAYHTHLIEGTSISTAIEATTSEATHTTLPEGWALKTTKKSTRFSEKQKSYLEQKFNLGQETGRKQDPEKVANDMRMTRKIDGSRLFSSDEFLTEKQIQSFFSRMASKLRHASDTDIQAAEAEKEYHDAREMVLNDVQLQHPIAYDSWNICNMYRKGTLQKT
ncbi:hypothetical protein QZH41_011297, partial [Actinostola sp. cb2023]